MLSAIVAGAVGLAVGGGLGFVAPSSGAAPAPQPTPSASNAVAPPTIGAVPAVTAPGDPLALDSTLPLSDVRTVETDLDQRAVEIWSTKDPASAWVMVNKANPLEPSDYEPQGLVSLAGLTGGAGERLTAEAAAALVDLRDAAVADGLDLAVASAYRSRGEQQALHRQYVSQWGAARAETFSARAAHSEHQTGWAVDVHWSSECRVKQCFADEPLGRWIAAHAWEHGWIVRYPDGGAEVTGYRYEPWHLRYVGVELSTRMHEEGVSTLEEALGFPAAPDYPD